MSQASVNPLDYYTLSGVMTDPGEYAWMLEGLPHDIAGICQAVQENMVHIFWAERYGLDLTEEQKETVNVRPVREKLARIAAHDPRPLCEPRPLDERQVGNCRDFSVLAASILRSQGIPARARCGFGTYFLPNHYEDHWVCEVWDASQSRWVMFDSQLDAFQQRELGIDFDPLDMPPGKFVIAGQAWQMCRRGEADPSTFGIFEYRGLWFIRGNVVRDFGALNKLEILPWDGGWGVLSKQDHEASEADWEYELFDRIADLSLQGNEVFFQIRSLYESRPDLQPPYK